MAYVMRCNSESCSGGMRVLIGVTGGGVWDLVVGVGFPVENEGNRGRGWGGLEGAVGTGKGTGKSMRTHLSKLLFVREKLKGNN